MQGGAVGGGEVIGEPRACRLHSQGAVEDRLRDVLPGNPRRPRGGRGADGITHVTVGVVGAQGRFQRDEPSVFDQLVSAEPDVDEHVARELGEAALVGEHVAHGDVGRRVRSAHLEPGDERRDPAVPPHQTATHQPGHDRGSHRFRHRRELKDGVARHRRGLAQPADAESLEVHDLVARHDGDRQPGNTCSGLALVHVSLERRKL